MSLSSEPIPRDIVYQSLRQKQPERCPYYIWICDEMVAPLARHYGAENFIGPKGGTRTFAGSYTAMTEIIASHVESDGEFFTDDYGVYYRRGSTPSVARPALPGPSLTGYQFPDLSTDRHFQDLDQWFETHADRFKIVQLGMMFFERTWGMRGMENILMDLHDNPIFVDELLDGLEEVCMKVIDRLLRDYGDRIDAIGMSEDYGTQKSLIISPALWRRFIKPHLRRMVRRVHNGGKLFYLHSCGHIAPIIGDLVELGIDMLQPLQPEAMDIFEIKRTYGSRLCLMGGISAQHLLPFGTPDDIRQTVSECLTRMASGGGYVMAPAKAILPGVPLENAIALIDAFVQQTRKPDAECVRVDLVSIRKLQVRG